MQSVALIIFGAALALCAMVVRTRTATFRAATPEDYDSTTPRFDVREHLDGALVCEGIIFGPTGRVVSRFVADFDASWSGDKGEIRETFQYDSGATQNRLWKLEVGDDGRITLDADDIVGPASGQQAGSAVLTRYRIRLPSDSGGHVLDVTDWMYRLGNGTIVNRSQFRKFGVTVAELCATIRPRSET